MFYAQSIILAGCQGWSKTKIRFEDELVSRRASDLEEETYFHPAQVRGLILGQSKGKGLSLGLGLRVGLELELLSSFNFLMEKRPQYVGSSEETVGLCDRMKYYSVWSYFPSSETQILLSFFAFDQCFCFSSSSSEEDLEFF